MRKDDIHIAVLPPWHEDLHSQVTKEHTHTQTYNTQVYKLKSRYGYQRHELKEKKIRYRWNKKENKRKVWYQ